MILISSILEILHVTLYYSTIIATACIPTITYIALFDKKDNGEWLGLFGYYLIKVMR